MKWRIFVPLGVVSVFALWLLFARWAGAEIEDQRQVLNEIHEEHLMRMRTSRDPDGISNDILWLAYWSDCYRRLITRHNWTHPLTPWANGEGDDFEVKLVGERAMRKIKTFPCPPQP